MLMTALRRTLKAYRYLNFEKTHSGNLKLETAHMRLLEFVWLNVVTFCVNAAENIEALDR